MRSGLFRESPEQGDLFFFSKIIWILMWTHLHLTILMSSLIRGRRTLEGLPISMGYPSLAENLRLEIYYVV